MRLTKPFFAYRSFNKETATTKRFYDAGVRQFCLFPANTVNSLGQYYSEYPRNWLYFDVYEFEHVDRQFNDLLAVAPEAQVIMMIDLNSPYWLVRSLACSYNVDSMGGLVNALTCQRWRDETLKYMQALLSHVEEAFPGRVCGYVLACGQTDEWFDICHGNETDTKREAYRKWCQEKGLTVYASIPTYAERARGDGDYQLRSPEKDQNALQYVRFLSDCVAESICFFAKEARKSIPDSTKLGCFFGYILELRWATLVQGAHLAYEKVFSSPDLDFFISPGDYSDRPMGGASGYMSPNGTLHQKDKNFFYEIDHRTHTANMKMTKNISLTWMDAWKNVKEDIAGLRREFCLALFHGASLWWFDMWGKFYEPPELLQEIQSMKEVYEQYADVNRQPDAEVAVIVDPESTFYITDLPDDTIATHVYRTLMDNLNKLGAPFRTYSFNDIPTITNLDKFKLVILPALFQVTPERKAMLGKYLLKDNRTILWTYAAGINDGIKDTPDAMKELTGFPYGTTECTEKEMAGWKSAFAPTSQALAPEHLRKLAATAGVHLFMEAPCPIWDDGKLMMVHTTKPGPQKITLKTNATAKILLGRQDALTQEGNTLFYDFNPPETILLEFS